MIPNLYAPECKLQLYKAKLTKLYRVVDKSTILVQEFDTFPYNWQMEQTKKWKRFE